MMRDKTLMTWMGKEDVNPDSWTYKFNILDYFRSCQCNDKMSHVPLVKKHWHKKNQYAITHLFINI